MDYCTYCEQLPSDDLNVIYHNTQYGFPIESDDELFGRLILEINQAGLSWITILKKQQNFREAFDQFSINRIAAYQEEDILRLMNNPGIIRNRLKIESVIHNAKVIQRLKLEEGSFAEWLNKHLGYSREEWTRLFKKTFKFTGGEIVNEFLMSSGYLKGAHNEKCPTFKEVLELKPKWLRE